MGQKERTHSAVLVNGSAPYFTPFPARGNSSSGCSVLDARCQQKIHLSVVTPVLTEPFRPSTVDQITPNRPGAILEGNICLGVVDQRR
jgi:hypothetical protein